MCIRDRDRLDGHAFEPGAGFRHHAQQPRFIQRAQLAVAAFDMQGGSGRRRCRLQRFAARLCAFLAVQHIGAGHFVMALSLIHI